MCLETKRCKKPRFHKSIPEHFFLNPDHLGKIFLIPWIFEAFENHCDRFTTECFLKKLDSQHKPVLFGGACRMEQDEISNVIRELVNSFCCHNCSLRETEKRYGEIGMV